MPVASLLLALPLLAQPAALRQRRLCPPRSAPSSRCHLPCEWRCGWPRSTARTGARRTDSAWCVLTIPSPSKCAIPFDPNSPMVHFLGGWNLWELRSPKILSTYGGWHFWMGYMDGYRSAIQDNLCSGCARETPSKDCPPCVTLWEGVCQPIIELRLQSRTTACQGCILILILIFISWWYNCPKKLPANSLQ